VIVGEHALPREQHRCEHERCKDWADVAVLVREGSEPESWEKLCAGHYRLLLEDPDGLMRGTLPEWTT
jgi:hypothetical protein